MIYEFRCPYCGAIRERKAKITKIPDFIMCKICMEEKGLYIPMKRIISKSTFILKGGGWSKNGYK